MKQRGFTIELGGQQRRCWLNFAAMAALGMKGPTDGEALTSALTGALSDFDKMAGLLVTLLAHEGKGDTIETIRPIIMAEWDAEKIAEFTSSISGRDPNAPADPAPENPPGAVN